MLRSRYLAVTALAPLMALTPGIASAQAPASTAPATAETAFPIADVIAQVKRELAAAEATPGAALGLKLDTVELNFGLTKTTDTNGKIAIGIPVLTGIDLSGSGEKKVEETSSLVIDLVPPKPVGTMSGETTKDFGITQAIVETRRQLLSGLNDPPALDPSKVVITLKFVITRTGGGSAQIKFLVFTLGGGKTLTSANSNSVTLTFAKAKSLQ